MSLSEQLVSDMKTAMKARDSKRLGVIRFLMSEVKKHEIDHGQADDQTIQSLIARQVKQTKEAISEFERGNRSDLVDQETEKLAVLEAYLPKQMDDAQLEEIVKQTVSGLDNPNMGSAMKAVMSKVQGQADGKRVSALVQKYLS